MVDCQRCFLTNVIIKFPNQSPLLKCFAIIKCRQKLGGQDQDSKKLGDPKKGGLFEKGGIILGL